MPHSGVEVLKTHGVIPVHRAFELQGEDEVQILAGPGYECASTLGGSDLEASIELGDIVFPQESVGPGQGVNAPQAEFLRQPSLPGSEIALTATTRLGRVGRNHLHPQLVQGPSHLGQALVIDFAPHLGGEPEMTAPVTV